MNTIKPVTRAFTAMEAAKPVRVNVAAQGVVEIWSCTTAVGISEASQVARGASDELKLAYQMKDR